MNYPGYVLRQTLIEQCQAKGEEAKKQAQKLFDAMDLADEKSAQMMYETAVMWNGKITAYREICEWAKDHLVPPPDVLANGAPIDDPKDISNV